MKNKQAKSQLSAFQGLYREQHQYQSFLPPKINKPYHWQDGGIDLKLEKATRLLGELKAYAQLVPDVDFFIKMHVVKEAITSSQIEGTKTGIDQAVLPKAEIEPEARDDWQEVQNYIKALNYAVDKLDKLPLSMRLLKQTHKILLSGVRGEHKLPGEIRRSQNWIGGRNLSEAFYIPPHPSHLPDLLSDLEKFWHNQDLQMPLLIKAAISHYQFETIHPFLDGNGRIGRLLIVLQLINQQFLQGPTLYISDFFAEHKQAYYQSLTEVRETGQIKQWLQFFLKATIQTAVKGVDTFDQIVTLRDDYRQQIMTLGGRAKAGLSVLNSLYSQPKVSINQVAELLDSSYVTANNLVHDLVELGILRETTGRSRNKIYSLYQYLNLFKD